MALKGSFTPAQREIQSNGAVHILGRTFLITKTLALAMLRHAHSCKCLPMLLLIAQSEQTFTLTVCCLYSQRQYLQRPLVYLLNSTHKKPTPKQDQGNVRGGSRIPCGWEVATRSKHVIFFLPNFPASS